MKKILALFSLVLLTAAFASAIQITPIDATLKAVDANGLTSFGNSTIAVQGVVANPMTYALDTNFSYFIVDTTTGWGINVFEYGGYLTEATVTTGDLITVVGRVTSYNGLLEINPTQSISKVGSGYSCPTTVIPSISACTGFDASLASGGEYYEGRLVRLNNVWISAGSWPAAGSNSATSLAITDYSGATIQLFIDKDTNVDGSTAPTTHFNLIGILSQYDSTSPYSSYYEIMPTIVEDITDVSDWAVMAK